MQLNNQKSEQNFNQCHVRTENFSKHLTRQLHCDAWFSKECYPRYNQLITGLSNDKRKDDTFTKKIVRKSCQTWFYLPTGSLLGVENRSSSVESPNKSELGLALVGGAATGFAVLGLEENSSSSSSSFSLSNRSAPFLGAGGLTV